MSKNITPSYLETNLSVFWSFMKEKYPVYKSSNVFFRDIQFGLKDFFTKRDQILDYAETEKLAQEVIVLLEQKGILKKLDNNTWTVNFLDDQVVVDSNL